MLRYCRQELGLSQIELAEAAQTPRYKIQLGERGIPIFTKAEARRLARILSPNKDEFTSWISNLIVQPGESDAE